jgi:hypothetical protein
MRRSLLGILSGAGECCYGGPKIAASYAAELCPPGCTRSVGTRARALILAGAWPKGTGARRGTPEMPRILSVLRNNILPLPTILNVMPRRSAAGIQAVDA